MIGETRLMPDLENMAAAVEDAFTELLTEARRESLERMMVQARELGANAIVNVRFATSSVASGAAELYVYGTAVRVD